MSELRPPPAGRKLILELRRELKAAGDRRFAADAGEGAGAPRAGRP